jgi:hypothetical protein
MPEDAVRETYARWYAMTPGQQAATASPAPIAASTPQLMSL